MTRGLATLALVACACLSRGVFAAPACARETLAGANVAGAEFNAGKPAAVHGRDYVYPAPPEVALLKSLDMRLMRVPFLWERLQPAALGELEPNELARLDAVVALAREARMTVVLDVHNYGSYRGTSLGARESPPGALPDLWRRLALHYGRDAHVAFGLMNEPHDIGVAPWAEIARQALAAIRATGATNIVLVPGTDWDGAHSWFTTKAGGSNADALLPLARDDERVVFEVHQYFDDDFSGTAPTCNAAARVGPALTRVGEWARSNRVRVMLGEFGVSQQPECVKALDDALAVIERDRDVWYGWTYWAAGAWWGNYPFNIQLATGTAPQADVLGRRAKTLSSPACRASS